MINVLLINFLVLSIWISFYLKNFSFKTGFGVGHWSLAKEICNFLNKKMNKRLCSVLENKITLNDTQRPRNSEFHQPLNQIKFTCVNGAFKNIQQKEMEVSFQCRNFFIGTCITGRTVNVPKRVRHQAKRARIPRKVKKTRRRGEETNADPASLKSFSGAAKT